MRRGYLLRRVIRVPEVLSETAVGSTSFRSWMVSSLLSGVHLMMHHPSEHCTTNGAESPATDFSPAMSEPLSNLQSRVNAM